MPFAPPLSLPFHRLSNFGAVKLSENVNEVIPSLCFFLFGSFECACLSKWTALVWSNECSLLSRSSVWHFLCCFFSLLPLLTAPIAGLSSSLFLAFEMRSLWFCAQDVFGPNVVSWVQTCNKNFKTSYFSTCILCRLASMLSGRLTVTADNTSSHFLTKAWTLSFFDRTLWSARWLHCRH